MRRVLSINTTAIVHEGEWTGSEGRTGIDKRAVAGPIQFRNEQVGDDVICDRKNHGGFDQAVYAYGREDADWWEGELGISIANGRFGENLTTSGFDVSTSVIGERWRIGTVVLEVSQPRIPCRVFAGFWERPTHIKDFMDSRRPGTYLRIIEEGLASAGDEIVVLSTPDHGMTVRDLFDMRRGEREKLQELLAVPQLSDAWRENVQKFVAGAR